MCAIWLRLTSSAIPNKMHCVDQTGNKLTFLNTGLAAGYHHDEG